MPRNPAPSRVRPSLRFMRLFILLAVLWAGGRAVGAEPSAPRRFDLPAGPAVVTLKRAAQQGGLEIVYSAALVRDVTTRAVSGDFAPHEALERMVADTPLTIIRDLQTGVLSVVRRTEVEVPPPPPSSPPKEPPRTMKRKNPLALIGTWLALALGAAGQTGDDAANPSTYASLQGRIANAATGQYLNNVRVTVRGTGTVTFSDQTGTYRLPQVPAGTVVLDVLYTGLDPQEVTVELAAGTSATRDIELTRGGRQGREGVVELDSFTVSTSRETDGQAIAANEQRFAPNVKNVVAADLMGDVMDGNVGEFLKFLPGITADYDNEDGSTIAYIAVRGFASNMATVMTDGAQMASTSTTFGDSRQFSFNSTSLNNISRVEVTKVPTPSSPADSLAGSVNLVTKSAFERKSAQFRYNVNFTGNSENLKLGREAHTTEKKIFKILPAANFDYTLPISPRLGLVLTGLTTRRYTKQHRSTTSYSNAGTSTGASLSQPYLSNYQMFNSPRVIARDSLGLRVDWKVGENGVLSAGTQWSHYASERIATQFTVNAGTNGTPTVAGGVPLTFGPDFVNGATGRGSVSMGGAASVHPDLTNRGANLKYRYDDGRWRLNAGYDRSTSAGGYLGTDAGNFRQFAITSSAPLRVNFRGSDPVRPTTIEIFDNNNVPWDMNDLRNYTLNTANSTPRSTRDEVETLSASARRTIDALAFPASIELGAMRREQTRDIRRYNMNWTYNGINGDRSPLPFASTLANNADNYYGFESFPHVSPVLAWRAYEANPALFSKTAAQLVAEESFRITNSLAFEETVSALYLQAEATLLSGRLKVVTGVRYEETDVSGVGPLVDPAAVWVRDPDGTFARDANGARIRKPEAGAVNSLEQLALTHRERAASNGAVYDGYYPSLHFTYNVSDNLLVRLAYAQTYGRPNLTEIIPNTTIDEFDLDDPNAIQGNITVTNPALKPWSADNYDLSVEYYTDQGGHFTIGAFHKDVTDFFGTSVFITTLEDTEALGLDPEYVNWRVTTRLNTGEAQIRGAEFSVRHSLEPLGGWGRHFTGFVNGTKLQLKGSRLADFAGFVPETLNWGLTFSRKPFQLMAKWNYRGRQRNGAQPAFGADGFTYQKRRLALDVNLEVQVWKDMILFFNAQNVFNEPYITEIYGSQTPAYARRSFTNHNGVGLTLGVKGSF